MNGEIWKDIPGYEGLYQASGLGRVRSLDRATHGINSCHRLFRGRILKLHTDKDGYLRCGLTASRIKRTHHVHKLIAMAFLNHTPNGSSSLVVDHINNIKTDNRLSNLQLVTIRYNLSKDKTGTSKYTGVSWHSRDKNWQASIRINGKKAYLGSFQDESEAALAYQNALEKHESLKKC